MMTATTNVPHALPCSEPPANRLPHESNISPSLTHEKGMSTLELKTPDIPPISYQKLGNPTRDIRLLHVLPSPHPDDRRLQCQLVTSSLRYNYAALSYTWGERDDRNLEIWVDGKLTPVHRNLICALRALQAMHAARARLENRTQNTSLVLWVDALCINQQDGDERPKQIALMSKIYENATQVIVWLGKPQEFNFRPKPIPAFELLRKASYRTQHIPLHIQPGFNWIKHDQDQWLGDFVYNDEFSQHWEQLGQLWSVEYWQRLWIIQEFCLAKNIQLLYDTDIINWRHFDRFWGLLGHLWKVRPGVLFLAPKISAGAIQVISQSRATKLALARLRAGESTLQELLEISQCSLCRNPRDKIYGLLGLAVDVLPEDILVNYCQSLFQLYANVLSFQIKRGLHPRTALRFSSSLQGALLWPVSRERVQEMAVGRRECIAERTKKLFPMPTISTYGIFMGKIIVQGFSWYGMPKEQLVEMDNRSNGHFMTQDSADISPVEVAWQRTLQALWEGDRETLEYFDPGDFPTDGAPFHDARGGNAGLAIFIVRGCEIGIAPSGIEDNDHLFHFPTDRKSGNNIFAILRVSNNGYRIIGRAILSKSKFRQLSDIGSGDTWPSPSFGNLGSEHDQRRPLSARFLVDIPYPTIQALTCPLNWTGASTCTEVQPV